MSQSLATLRKIPVRLSLFLFFLSVYLFTMSGTLEYGDEAEKYLVAQSIVERQEFSFRPTVVRTQLGLGDRNYSVYEIGTSLFQVPFYLLGRYFLSYFPMADANWITMLFVGLLNPVLSALACVLFSGICLRLGMEYRTSLVLTVVYGLGTIAWPYSKGFSREPVLTLFILLLLYSAIRFRQSQNQGWLAAHGIFAGGLVFAKLIQAAVLPFFLLYILVAIVQTRAQNAFRPLWRDLFQAGVIFSLPVLFFLGLQSAYSMQRFGTFYGGLGGTRANPLEIILELVRDADPMAMSQHLLVSEAKSVFLYSPPITLFFFGWLAWLRLRRNEALLVLGLILISFLSAASRPDGDASSWWGPRYLVQVAPLFILPIGALLERQGDVASRFWRGTLAILFSFGVLVQLVGVLTSSRVHYDITDEGPRLSSQFEFLRYGALDSLWLYLSPTGLTMNPLAVVLLFMALVFGLWLAFSHKSNYDLRAGSLFHGTAVALVFIVVVGGAFTHWAVASYPRVLAARGNTKYVTADSLFASGKECQAEAMYRLAMAGETDYVLAAKGQVDRFLGIQGGMVLTPGELARQIEGEEGTRVDEDSSVTLSGLGSVRITADGGNDATVRAISRAIPVERNTTYRISGWTKKLNIYGAGSMTVTLYEDDGNWKRPRDTEIASGYQTSGWEPFTASLQTLSTTQRLFIKTGLWKTFGTVWVDEVRIEKLENGPELQSGTLPSCKK